ncbi:MAG: GrpB family protein [Candidatus Hodarchaeales archaeon]|jgi:GrpB-like predicted nucleotidyltransferase (UPF0157 family)
MDKPPITIVEYDSQWPERYQKEKKLINSVIDKWILTIEHIGSTAVTELGAKPIIDIMIGIESLEKAKYCFAPLESIGYKYIPKHESSIPERRYFNKGPDNCRTHHLHMVELNSEFWTRHLLFRDYLRSHPETKKEYYTLKKKLAKKYRTNTRAYTDAKTKFIRGIEEKAIQESFK